MRRLSMILLAASGLAACSNSVQPIQRTARQQEILTRALAGKVAQRPVACLPTFRSSNMEVVDDNTILFHDGSSRVYLQSPSGGCSPLGSGNYTLVTQLRGSSSLCRGDISRVADLTSGTTVGSCAMNDFIPYVRPR